MYHAVHKQGRARKTVNTDSTVGNSTNNEHSKWTWTYHVFGPGNKISLTGLDRAGSNRSVSNPTNNRFTSNMEQNSYNESKCSLIEIAWSWPKSQTNTINSLGSTTPVQKPQTPLKRRQSCQLVNDDRHPRIQGFLIPEFLIIIIICWYLEKSFR